MIPLAINRPDAVAALAEPPLRALYEFVVASDAPVSRDRAAEHLSTPRSTVALQLERLVAVDLLAVDQARLSGRTGPGAGRPAKLYRATGGEVIASSPERHYELAAELLASAVQRSEAEGLSVPEALSAQAHDAGERIGAASDDLHSALTACGYEPLTDGDGRIVLANCPFHALAQRHTALICTANLALVQGIVDGAEDPREPVLAPTPNRCCVAITPATGAIETADRQTHRRAIGAAPT